MTTTIEAQTVEYLYRPIRKGQKRPAKNAVPVKRSEAHYVIRREDDGKKYRGRIVSTEKTAEAAQQSARELAKKEGAKLAKHNVRQQVVA